jgi:hypothetical protein
MYRINVITTNKHNSVSTGYRYCLTQSTAKRLIKVFLEKDCEIEVERFIHIHSDIFAWSTDIGRKFDEWFVDNCCKNS